MIEKAEGYLGQQVWLKTKHRGYIGDHGILQWYIHAIKLHYSSVFQSLALSKQLIRSVEKEKLYAVNSQECEQIVKKYFSKESMNAFKSFFQKKSKM